MKSKIFMESRSELVVCIDSGKPYDSRCCADIAVS